MTSLPNSERVQSSSATLCCKTGRIRVRFGGKVIQIDTGMQTQYVATGRASALEIKDGRLYGHLSGSPRRPRQRPRRHAGGCTRSRHDNAPTTAAGSARRGVARRSAVRLSVSRHLQLRRHQEHARCAVPAAYSADRLPCADVASALTVAVVMAAYLRVHRRIGLRPMLVGTLLAFSAVSVGF